MKKIVTKLQESNPDRVAPFKAAAQPAIKKILETFKDWDFYQGESQNDEGMVALLNFREDGVTPYMLFFRDGLLEEKVVSIFLPLILSTWSCFFFCSEMTRYWIVNY